jgi:thioredoxin reductase (NADPH)
MPELIIIGAGPAGLTAGLYAGRFRINTLILERMLPGGQIILSSTIENFPGFPGGVSTQELIDRLKKQVEDAGVDIINAEAEEISRDVNSNLPGYAINAGSQSYETKAVIIASGARFKRLGVKGEDRLIGRGVSYCGTCDGPLFKGKEIVVVGGGDRAIEEAIFLASYASKVTVIHRRQELRASAILQEKVKANPGISFILHSVIEEISGENKVEAVRIKNLKSGTFSAIPCQGAFIFVGIKPETDFVQKLLKVDGSGFIITGQDMQGSQPGIFACGDCRAKSLYQVVNGCGEGAVAADSAHKYLLELG